MIAALYWPDPDIMNTETAGALLPFDPDSIDEIYVEDAQGNEAILLKMSDLWILPDLAGMPVDPQMIEKLRDSLSNRAGEWPIATTPASRQRFQVAAYHFQRRLTLIGAGELLGTIYLGTSPGFRKVHARNDAQSAIYSLPYNSYNAHANASAWLDRSLLQTSDPLRIASAQYSISKGDLGWITAPGGQPDERELSALLLGLRSLQVDGIADEDQQRTLAIAAPELSLEIETEGGPIKLEFITIGTQHYIHSSRYDYFFTLSAYDFDRLTTIDAVALNNENPR